MRHPLGHRIWMHNLNTMLKLNLNLSKITILTSGLCLSLSYLRRGMILGERNYRHLTLFTASTKKCLREKKNDQDNKWTVLILSWTSNSICNIRVPGLTPELHWAWWSWKCSQHKEREIAHVKYILACLGQCNIYFLHANFSRLSGNQEAEIVQWWEHTSVGAFSCCTKRNR